MTRKWLVRLALWLVPRSWRDAVRSDLEDEARAEGRGALWSFWQTVRLAIPLRWAVSGDAAWFDLRYAFRSLRAAPLFALTAVIAFALGIGVNVAVFSAVELQTMANVAILNDAAARLIWPLDPSARAVGRTLQLPGDPPRDVVGVVPVLKTWRDTQLPAALYIPKGSEPAFFNAAVVRMEPGRMLDVRTVRTALTSRVGEARVDVQYVPATLEPFIVDPRFRAALLGTLAVTGLVLAAVGLYAVASSDVALRRYETGVRLALGATAREISKRVIRETCRPVFVGIAAGLVFSFWSAQFFQTFLRRVDGRDPWTYALVALTLLATAIAAAWLPARRTASTDPATVLRAQ